MNIDLIFLFIIEVKSIGYEVDERKTVGISGPFL